MDLVIEDDSRVGCVYFTMSERTSGARSTCRGSASAPIRLRWLRMVSSCARIPTHGPMGSFARLLGGNSYATKADHWRKQCGGCRGCRPTI